MKIKHLKIITAIFLIVQLLILAYLTFIAYWLSTWFIDDSVAFSITESEWTKIAAIRVIQFGVVALVFSGILHFANNILFRKIGIRKSTRLSLIVSSIVFLSILISSIAGAIQFVIEKPWF